MAQTVTPLPTPVPSRADPANFAARGDMFLGALPLFATELNQVALEVSASNSNCNAQAAAATQAKTDALAAASAATTARNAAQTSAANASQSEGNAAGSLRQMERLYLGPKSSPPTTDNQGDPLAVGCWYTSVADGTWFWWSGSAWKIGILDPDTEVVSWDNVLNKPSTIAGYGITDAVTINTIQTIEAKKTFLQGTLYRRGISLNNGGANSGFGGTNENLRCIQFTTDVNFAGNAYDDHSAFMIYPTMPAGWTSGEMRVAIASGPGSYATNSPALIINNAGLVANNFTIPSDRTLKKNITLIDNPLDRISKMNGVFYHLKSGDDKERKTGLIAQEVKDVLPEAVYTIMDGEGKPKLAVSYSVIVGVLVEGVKAISKKLDDIVSKTGELIKRVDEMNKRLDKLEKGI